MIRDTCSIQNCNCGHKVITRLSQGCHKVACGPKYTFMMTLSMHGDLSTRRICDVVVVNTIGKALYIYLTNLFPFGYKSMLLQHTMYTPTVMIILIIHNESR